MIKHMLATSHRWRTPPAARAATSWRAWHPAAPALALCLALLAPGAGAQNPAGATTSGAAAPSPALNPNPVPASVMAHTCAACHGTNGQLGDEAFKPLAGMPVEQFVRTMIDFREGRRPSTLMGHVARGFTNADLQAMAEFFAAIAPTSGPQPTGGQR